MKNIICPVSTDKIQSHIPRITAFLVISSILLYSFTQWSAILLFLVLDFSARATNNPQWSLISIAARFIGTTLKINSAKVDKAPKVFAARLGAIMFAAALIFHFSGLYLSASITTLLVAILATLECAFNFCVGCVIYSTFVFPFFAKN